MKGPTVSLTDRRNVLRDGNMIDERGGMVKEIAIPELS